MKSLEPPFVSPLLYSTFVVLLEISIAKFINNVVGSSGLCRVYK